jgi:hypothetical protein
MDRRGRTRSAPKQGTAATTASGSVSGRNAARVRVRRFDKQANPRANRVSLHKNTRSEAHGARTAMEMATPSSGGVL